MRANSSSSPKYGYFHASLIVFAEGIARPDIRGQPFVRFHVLDISGDRNLTFQPLQFLQILVSQLIDKPPWHISEQS